MDLLELADRLKGLKEHKKELESKTKEVNTEIERIEGEMIQLMLEQEVGKFERAGSTFYINTRLFASPVAERKQELYEALKTEGYGDLVQEIVNANSLSAFIKEQMEDNEDQLPEWLEGLVNVYEKNTIGIRRSK